jgi:hypothetical protein
MVAEGFGVSKEQKKRESRPEPTGRNSPGRYQPGKAPPGQASLHILGQLLKEPKVRKLQQEPSLGRLHTVGQFRHEAARGQVTPDAALASREESQ